jgi:homoserine O-succinyltransferase
MPIMLERSAGRPITDIDAPTGLRDDDALEIGLVNNVPDAALASTERQFLQLLQAAAGDLVVRVRLFALADMPRGAAGREHLRHHADIDDLRNSRLDGLIVTGTEPQAASLTEEPYWESLTGVVEWALDNTLSAIWSCLAAHAAVLQLDGVGRRTLAEKRLGVFECTRTAEHPLTAGLPARLSVAHSRCNELSEEALASCGYRILTRSHEAGVDTFVREGKSLFVFFEGHPEYDERALLRELRREVGRFLRGERPSYPAVPAGYFGEQALATLARWRAAVDTQRCAELLGRFPFEQLECGLRPLSRLPATRIYENWLGYLRGRKAEQGPPAAGVRPLRVAAPAPGIG